MFHISLKSAHNLLLGLELELSRELNIEGQVQVAFFTSALDRHTLVSHQFASLWADLLVHGDSQTSSVESAEFARNTLESIKQTYLLGQNKIVALPAVALMFNLFEFDDQVCSNMTR